MVNIKITLCVLIIGMVGVMPSFSKESEDLICEKTKSNESQFLHAEESAKNPENVRASAREREQDASEDPLRNRDDEELANEDDDGSGFEFYGSVRVRYRAVDSAQSVWEDSGSRLGLNGYYEVVPESWLFARYEMGFNLLREFGLEEEAYQPDQEFGHTIFTRLAYVGVEIDSHIIAYGKNWSTYYQVAEFTDRFDSIGGEASGAYNAMTDGGPSGTGRADNVLQARLSFGVLKQFNNLKPLSVNFQFQHGEPIPEIDGGKYGMGYGVSTILELGYNFSVGIAYNYADVDIEDVDPDYRNGINGDLSALLVGARWYNGDWYLGCTLSKTKNLHTADNQQYFNGTGLEFYGQYQMAPDIWLVSGFNQLTPDSNQSQVGSYTLRYAVFGLRYSIKDFSRMLYLESRIDYGHTSDNQDLGDQLIFGLRWGF